MSGDNHVDRRDEWNRLLRAAVEDRDVGALNQLLKKLAPSALNLARGIVGNHHDAEDVVQRAFGDFWNSQFKSFEMRGTNPGKAFKAFLLTKVRWVALNRLAKSRSSREVNSQEFPEAIDDKAETHDSIVRKEELEWVLNNLPSLTPALKDVVREITQGKSIKETATELGLRANTAEVSLNRAQQKLKKLAKDQGMTDS